MKQNIILIAISLALFLRSLNAQIYPPQNAIDGDTCIFDIPCEIISIDTSQPNNIWQIGEPSKTIFDKAYIGTRTLITDSINAYDTSSISSFTIQLVHTNSITTELVFWHRYETDRGRDGGYIELSYDLGKTWFNLLDWDWCPYIRCPNVGPKDIYERDDTLSDGEPGFSGSSNGWQKSSFYCTRTFYNTIIKDEENSLSKREIQDNIISDTTMVRFTFVSDTIPDNKDGWCIDNMMLFLHYDPAGINSNKISNKVSLYPNPANDNFTYNCSFPISSISIYDPLGTIMGRFNNPDQTIEIDELPNGLYYVVFYSKCQMLTTEKLLILK